MGDRARRGMRAVFPLFRAFYKLRHKINVDRLMWGSDFPVSHFRGRCVAIGDEFLWLYENTLDWDTVAGYARIYPFFVAHESLRALKLAVTRLHLSDSQIDDIFRTNGLKLFGLQPG